MLSFMFIFSTYLYTDLHGSMYIFYNLIIYKFKFPIQTGKLLIKQLVIEKRSM